MSEVSSNSGCSTKDQMPRTETVSDIYVFNAQKSFLKREFFKLAIQEDHCIVFNHLCGPLRLLIFKRQCFIPRFFFTSGKKLFLILGLPLLQKQLKKSSKVL